MAAMVCELWIAGTDEELDAVLSGLETTCRALYVGDRVAMTGADRGRHRVYVRVAVARTPQLLEQETSR